jgi:hypothetical protein
MTRSVFRNASGLPNPRQITTARDLVTLGRAIHDRFPRFYPYFGTRSFEFDGYAYRNHNKLLGRVEGVDGIKTGFTRASGFNLLTSVKTDGRHIIGVVLGVPMGIAGAVWQDRWPDQLVRVIGLVGYSVPIFWLGIIGLLVFYGILGWVQGPGRLGIFFEDMVPTVTGVILIDAAMAGEWEVFRNAFGHVVLAWVWLDVALAAWRLDPAAAPAPDARAGADEEVFLAGKRAAMRYFFAYELPKIDAWLAVVARREPLVREFDPLSLDP